ncbi:alanine/glycine:cation symporter family protein [Porticoccus litoralis]|uniref:Sodium:alanine symporter family protein n=1 Tax=Porticoccus litoralis TaxID=434086 RepID=A0AAW8B4G2_9GAMM|nr:sodium:alanine symporter family protein [Porticoccus litoralis]MDP1521340.1 sodium:alanine symporter family protein [Porticoccus litoralis]TNE88444.1 MAG: sodium:alanine symporter family protein [Gammaproteobacteria bacterium]
MLQNIVNTINGFVWGPVMLVLILGTGLYLTIGLRGLSIRKIGYGFRQLFIGRRGSGEGDISPFNALMTSLSATVGTGNIVGVATAVGIGGPGALFWMWCTALVGMATKYSEAVLAVHYRETDERGRKVGGPMYYIRNGLGPRWAWLALCFALFGTLAGFGIGNTVQANSVADALRTSFNVPEWLSGILMAVLVGLVLLGGIRRIASVAGKLVPFMALLYLVVTLSILAINIGAIPEALLLVVKSAFSPVAAGGGFAGATIMLALRMGVARGIFSNEAGLGSAPIAHAAAEIDNPVRQGTIAMLGTFIDTLVICTLTGLVLITTGAWNSGEQGAALTNLAFNSVLPFGDHVVSLCLALFAFTTILGWSYYGERCAEYLFGVKVIVPFRVLWVIAVYVGATLKLGLVWSIADTLNGMMAIPNLVGLLLLSPVIFSLTREYFSERR